MFKYDFLKNLEGQVDRIVLFNIDERKYAHRAVVIIPIEVLTLRNFQEIEIYAPINGPKWNEKDNTLDLEILGYKITVHPPSTEKCFPIVNMFKQVREDYDQKTQTFKTIRWEPTDTKRNKFNGKLVNGGFEEELRAVHSMLEDIQKELDTIVEGMATQKEEVSLCSKGVADLFEQFEVLQEELEGEDTV